MTNPARSGPPKDPPVPPSPPPQPPSWRRYLLPVGLAITAILLFGPLLEPSNTATLTYSTFYSDVSAGKVRSVQISSDGSISGVLKSGQRFDSELVTAEPDPNLLPLLRREHVATTGVTSSASFVGLLIDFLPLLLLIGFFVWSGRAASRQLAGLGGIGRHKAKVVDLERPTTRFSDVAGYDGAKREIAEIVDFLRRPATYAQAGAVGPKGVLMIGPPGTGKTLLARAVAGEAAVPFLALTGSAFVEMFVGVGASRVRDLFGEARKMAPAIIFIDEIDAIGQRRGGAVIGNDEREQTLNQMLAEMDGFDSGTGVVVLAATNRPEVLDPALLRAGRFDRHVTVPLPTQRERRAILEVHARGRRLGPDVDFDVIARGTPGFSGADLANLLNEAAITAVRDRRDTISAADLDEARDRLLIGRRDGSNVLLPDEKRAVAVHESGHALAAVLSANADPVAKVTILPAGMALGVTEQLPLHERHLYSESYLRDSLVVRLGGRAAELVVFGEGSTGAANDLASATELATRMVREFGLSPALGPVGYSGGSPMFLGSEEMRSRTYSEDTQRVVDTEVARLLREAEQRAVDLLTEHRDALDRLAEMLLEHETIDGTDVEAIAAGRPAVHAAGRVPPPPAVR